MLSSDVVELDAAALGVPIVSTAMNARGSRCYLGAASHGHLRENLGVLTLDASGSQVGEPRWYPVGTETLPAGHLLQVAQIRPNPNESKLYLALSRNPKDQQRQLAVIDLVDGEPTGECRAYASGNPLGYLTAVALHPDPDVGVLYAVGHGGQGVAVHKLAGGEPDGAPVWVPLPGGQGKYDVAVSADGARLYLGTYPDTLQVVQLDPAGSPLPATTRSFAAGAGPDGAGYLRFTLTPRAIYRRRPASATKPEWPLASWRLGPDGLPAGELRVHPELAGRSTLIDHAGDRLIVLRAETTDDAFTGTPVASGSVVVAAPLGADGAPGAPTDVRQLPRRTGVNAGQLASSGTGRVAVLTRDIGGAFLVNEVSGWHFRITPVAVRTAAGPVAGPVLYLGVPGGDNGYLLKANLGAGQPSPWVSLDPVLRGQSARRLLSVESRAGTTPIVEMTLTIDIAAGNPAQGGTALRSMTDTVTGNFVRFLVPGYDVRRSPDREAAVQLLSEYAEGLLPAALAVALPDERRPKAFPISCTNLAGGQGHRGQLDAEVRTVRALGINTAIVHSWGALPPAEVADVLNRHGLTKRAGARYRPPSLFSFDTDQLNPAAAAAWAQARIGEIINANGATREQIVDFKLADEPGWYFPSIVAEIKAKPGWLEAFRSYLKEQGLEPGDVGADDWSQVLPIARGDAGADDESRRLFRATTRFLTESASDGLAMVRRAMLDELGHPAFLDVNINLKPNRWYVAHPNQKAFKNPDNPPAGDPAAWPSLAIGGFDWFHAGRRSAFTQWSMDSAADHDPQHCSYLGDVLRSAAAHGTAGWGAYLKGNQLGVTAAGPSYKMLSLIGHGAGIVDLFAFGPLALAVDGWSDLTHRYGNIARAVGLVGAAEDYLVGAVPATGTVALLIPTGSHLWDAGVGAGLYLSEVEHLHTALVHSGYPVDLVDEHDLETGALSRYRALYLTGPNLSVRAQQAVAAWVASGGVLAVTPGAATADELDRPTAVLDPVLGLPGRSGERFQTLSPLAVDEIEFGTGLAIADTDDAVVERPTFLDRVYPFMPALGPITPLPVDEAKAEAVAVFRSNGRFAVSRRRHGQGTAVGYGFFPGALYHRSADRSRTTRLPAGWGATQRAAAVAPARIAGAARPVQLDVPGVEACRLDRKIGGAPPSAIVLLNWTGRPVRSVEVTVPNTSARRARSVQRGQLQVSSSPAAGVLRLSLPLDDVDVLLLG